MAAAIALIGGFEGLRLTAYKDIVGVPTVCYGETKSVRMGDKYSRKECEIMLGSRLKEFEDRMRSCLKNPDDIPEGAYLSFLSLSYNVGSAGFCRSTVARRANNGNLHGACDALLMWNKAGGQVVQGLVNRRKKERKLCLESL